MNSPLTSSKKLLLPVVSAVVLLASVCVAQAQVLLDVQISSGTVTITATGTSPETDASTLFNNGFDLLNVFTNNVGFTGFDVLSSTLTTGDSSSGPIFNTAVGDNISTLGTDLTLYSTNPTANETFTMGDAAFTGTITLDLVGSGATIVSSGTGTIVTGYSGSSPNTQIGTWQVVDSVAAPEPTSWTLLLVGITLFAICPQRASVLRFKRAASLLIKYGTFCGACGLVRKR